MRVLVCCSILIAITLAACPQNPKANLEKIAGLKVSSIEKETAFVVKLSD